MKRNNVLTVISLYSFCVIAVSMFIIFYCYFFGVSEDVIFTSILDLLLYLYKNFQIVATFGCFLLVFFISICARVFKYKFLDLFMFIFTLVILYFSIAKCGELQNDMSLYFYPSSLVYMVCCSLLLILLLMLLVDLVATKRR